jgi:hypothetical protein
MNKLEMTRRDLKQITNSRYGCTSAMNLKAFVAKRSSLTQPSQQSSGINTFDINFFVCLFYFFNIGQSLQLHRFVIHIQSLLLLLLIFTHMVTIYTYG